MKLTPFLLCLVLAIGSFAFARHQYVSERSVSLTNPFNKSQTKTVAFADDKIFGDWVKDKWVFAIAVPVGLLAAGAVLALKK